MTRNLMAIFVIYCCAGIAWAVLGATVLDRTQESDSSQSGRLSAQWGSAQYQAAPTVSAALRKSCVKLTSLASRIDVGLKLERRRKGLLWYSLYDVRFSGRYLIRNDSPSHKIAFAFSLPSDVRRVCPTLHLAQPASRRFYSHFADRRGWLMPRLSPQAPTVPAAGSPTPHLRPRER
jgi:hypothetical protein